MRAVVFVDTRGVRLQDAPDAEIEEPSDVVARVTSSAICGTDPHMYDGCTGATPGLVLGHEPLAVVESVGSAVTMVKRRSGGHSHSPLLRGLRELCAGLSAACLRVRTGASVQSPILHFRHLCMNWRFRDRRDYKSSRARRL